jgi:Leucine-rich repeat (LRR) protein
MCIICSNEYNEQTFKINCLGCTKIQTLPDPTKLPRITELYISYTKIQEIPEYKTLKILHCDYTRIQNIPVLPILTELYCSNSLIRKLSFLPRLINLHCNNTDISYLPTFPNLQRLSCISSGIKEIKFFPRLYFLVCNDCRFLVKVDPLYKYNTYVMSCPWMKIENI